MNVGRRFINKNNAKKVARLAAAGLGAGVLGTIGLAAGLASDNDADILKYGGLGLGTGYMAGGATLDAASALKNGAVGIKDDFQRGWYGDDYQNKLNKKSDKEWMKDRDVIDYYRRKYGNYKQAMKDALVLRQSGITDQKEIDTALGLLSKHDGHLDPRQVADIMNFSKEFNKTDILKNRSEVSAAAERLFNVNPTKAEEITQLLEERFKLR